MDFTGGQTVPALWAEQCERRSDHPFLVFEDRNGTTTEYTYAAFNDRVQRTATAFASLGIEPGDHVMLHLDNSPALLQSWFALLELGAVTVFSNTECTARETKYNLEASSSVLAVTEPAHHSVVANAATETAVNDIVVARIEDTVREAHSLHSLVEAAAATPPPVSIDGETPAEIIFTSGTTSDPKPVLLTHRNLRYFGQEVKLHVAIRPHDRMLAVLPGYHANAQFVSFLSTLAAGATLVLSETFTTDGFVEQLGRHQPTLTSLGAPHVRALLAKPERTEEANHDLREVGFGLNITEAERHEFERRFDAPLLKLYGTSEHGIFTFQPIDGDRNWSKMTLGRPAFGRTVQLVDSEGVPVEQGERGEIAVDGRPGRDIMQEYYGMPERTAEAFTGDGLLTTGDVGRFDERGFLSFETRTKHIIETRGENVSQEEVESILEAHPAVAEAVAIGIPHEVYGEAVLVLVIREDDSLDAATLNEYAELNLASFKRPERIEFVSEFPRTSVGKVEKKALEEQYAGEE